MHLALTLLVAFAIAAPIANACFAAGVCGGGCPPPMPAPSCGGGCGGGYGCGQYGCYRMRARARTSKTLSFDSEEEPTPTRPQTPDDKFLACCMERKLPDTCLSKCSYTSFNRQALQNMYFRVDKCPMQAAADIQYCAAQGRDHTACCVRNGVASTLAGPKCLTFCDQRPGNVTQLDLSYMACYDRFDSMKSCFYHDITRGSGRRSQSRFN
uniref:DB domain-containing protein n=1 Tax=Panagrellus redivivus TaxID=6233 RepID=A0A7E4V2C8_PANRE